MKKNNAVIKFRTLTGNADSIRLKVARAQIESGRVKDYVRRGEKLIYESTVALWKV